MKRKRILSLLLALAVMATMLMAVPLTANAATSYRYTVPNASTTISHGTDLINNSDVVVQTIFKDGSDTANSVTSGDTSSSCGDSSSAASSYTYCIPIRTSGTISSAISSPVMDNVTSTILSDKTGYIAGIYVSAVVGGTAELYFGTGSTSDSGRSVVVWDNTSGKMVYDLGDNSTSDTGKGDIFSAVFTAEAGHEYIVYTGKFGAVFLEAKFTPASPSLSLDSTALSMTAGSETTLTASFSNTDDAEVKWTSSDEDNLITVAADSDDSKTATVTVAEGAEVDYSATITATATTSDGTTLTATCTVTVVAPTKELTIYVDSAITDITFTNQDDETDTATLSRSAETLTRTSIIMQGTVTLSIGSTYDITYTNAAPLTYNNPTLTELEVTSSMNDTQDLRGGVIYQTENTFDDFYTDLVGKTIVWGYVDDTYYPTSFGYIEQIETSKYWYVAGAESGNTSNSDVYAVVNGGKLHTNGRANGGFQFNANTDFRVPVIKGSTVTIVNKSSDTTDTQNNVYTVSENGGDTTQVGTLTESGATSTSVYSYTYRYTDDTNGYVDIVSVSGNYLSSITVEYPETLLDSPYEDWYVGYNSSGTLGLATATTVDDVTDALKITGLNVYNPLTESISSGTYYFSVDMYLDNDTENNGDGFRIYLENSTAGKEQPTSDKDSNGNFTGLSTKVIATPVYSNQHGTIIGTGAKVTGDPETTIVGSSETAAETGWYNFLITVAYTDGTPAITLRTLTPSGEVYSNDVSLLSGTSDYALKQIRIVTRGSNGSSNTIIANPQFGTYVFGEGDTDSGKYKNSDDETVGVIRFLQEFIGDTSDMTGYGFYFVKDSGEIEGGTGGQLSGEGYYYDITDIPDTETDTTYYARPYIVTSDGTEYGATISGSVDWDTEVEDPTASEAD